LLLLLLFGLISDTGSGDPRVVFDRAHLELFRGHLAEAQLEAHRGFQRFASNSVWAPRFGLLAADSMVSSGIYDRALSLLRSPSSSQSIDDNILRLTLLGVALTRLQRLQEADAAIEQAETLCAKEALSSCVGVTRARGILFLQRGELADARTSFFKSLDFARAHHDKRAEATALMNLGAVSLHAEHYDEAVDWISSGHGAASQVGDENLDQLALGNLGWAYFQLGDLDRGLDLTEKAENAAMSLGNSRLQINWTTTAANIYRAKEDWPRAIDSLKRALALAKTTNNKEYVVNALEDLVQTYIDAGRLSDAEDGIRELRPLISQTEDRLDALDIEFAEGRLASAQNRWKDAIQLFELVEHDHASQTSMRMGAEHALARLYESSGDLAAAEHMYRTAITTFESAREQLKNEDSKLPFLTNASDIYDDYIRFLIGQDKPDEALKFADQSRAQTLAQGLGVPSKSHSVEFSVLRPNDIARRSGATLLFYSLGEKQSYLWAITPAKTILFTLPPEREITESIKHYRKALLGLGDPAEDSNPDGVALYRLLIQPAASLIRPNANLVILSDGDLSQLNFETLIVPAPHPHYLIEDATITSAASLHLLASARSSASAARKLLLMGDAISPNPDYPELPMAGTEMKQIEQQFNTHSQTVIAREQANPAAYLAANPQQFAYIHFVAHGVASRTDPLDSAIILSRSSAAEDSFKLHARDIIQHPIRASLVTVSACYGSGTRSYAGEGSIGLAWAFLRAGAHNVIGALWEVSDEATPQLMGDLYHNLDRGLSPSAALREAKLTMLHSHKEFRKPFYWAPLQIYTGL
jgi:CHAT domain-containing protein